MIKEDRRFIKTKQAITEAMWQLMQEKDFVQISVGEIADRANINRVTFYRHYVDKYDWLEQCISELLQEWGQISDAVYSATEDAQLQRAFLTSLRHFDQNFHLYSILLKNKGTLFFQERFKKMHVALLRSAIEPEHSRSAEMDFEFHFVASAASGCIEWWIQNNRPLTVEQMAQKMFDIHRNLPWYLI